jgi:hypothetical protein
MMHAATGGTDLEFGTCKHMFAWSDAHTTDPDLDLDLGASRH